MNAAVLIIHLIVAIAVVTKQLSFQFRVKMILITIGVEGETRLT